MAITEEDRYELFKVLEGVLGRARASTLMEHLPPIGWADVATKRDLEQLADRLRAEFRLDTRNIVFAMIASNATFAALTVAAARLV